MSKATNKTKASKATTAAKTGAAKTYICKVNLAHDNDKRLPLNRENFSPLKSGGFRPMCKKCQVIKSKEWTDAKKPMRQVQATIRGFQKAGVQVDVPSAKGFDIKAVVMTRPHTVMPNGKIVDGRAEGGSFKRSEPAVDAFNRIKKARDAEKAKAKSATPVKAKAATAKGNGKAKAKATKPVAKATPAKKPTPKATPAPAPVTAPATASASVASPA